MNERRPAERQLPGRWVKVMTERETKAERDARNLRAVEQIQARALKRFGQAIFSACAAYEKGLEQLTPAAGLKIRDIPDSADYRLAAAVTAFLGNAFLRAGSADRFELSHDERRTLRRLHGGLRPRVDARNTGEAAELAESIVGEVARQRADPSSSLTPEAWAVWLSVRLMVEVHPAFGKLRECAGDVSDLLSRFTTGKGRKPRKGEPSKLAPAGIVCALNKLPRDERGRQVYPLGRGLNANGVDRAIDRYRKQIL